MIDRNSLINSSLKFNNDELVQAVNYFIHTGDINPIFRKTDFGVNNFVFFVDINESQFVLRIYNNGDNISKIKTEHELLVSLQSFKLPFEIPKALPHRFTQVPFAQLPNGRYVSLFYRISGVPPKLSK